MSIVVVRIVGRLPLVAFVSLAVVLAACVTTQRGDSARSGVFIDTRLPTRSTDFATFGFVGATQPLSSPVLAQPIFLAAVPRDGGRRDILYVFAQDNTAYMFDIADLAVSTAAVPFAQVSLGPSRSDTDQCVIPGLTGCTPIFDRTAWHGLSGTPAVDTSAPLVQDWAIFVVTFEASGGARTVYRLHKLHVYDLSEFTGWPVTIQSLPGTTPQFDPMWQRQRSGVLISHGWVYVAFSAFLEQACLPYCFPFHGWVFAYDAANPLRTAAQWPSTSDTIGGGIWGSGGGLAASDDGAVYVSTGNAYPWPPTDPSCSHISKVAVTDPTQLRDTCIQFLGNNGWAPMGTRTDQVTWPPVSTATDVRTDRSDSLVRLSLDVRATPSLSPVWYYRRSNPAGTDADFGAGGPILTPDNLTVIVGAKRLGSGDPNLFLFDAGSAHPGCDPSNPLITTCPSGLSVDGSGESFPLYWNGRLFIWPVFGPLTRLTQATSPLFMDSSLLGSAMVSRDSVSHGVAPRLIGSWPSPGPPGARGVLWAQTIDGLYAYDPERLTQLWHEAPLDYTPGHFVDPIIAGGLVLVATSDRHGTVRAYGRRAR